MPRRLARGEWREAWWIERDGERVVPCSSCRKLDAERSACRVPFGSPLRKCVAASVEAHLADTRGLECLELGFGRRSIARRVIEAAGGYWTGLEPGLPPTIQPARGRAAFGHAGDIRFPDETFDRVLAVQSLEHWEAPHAHIAEPCTYGECFAEVWRVLKPGGRVYFDAPMHLHGHEMFVAGDVSRVLSLFDPELWTDIVSERWRMDHAPLPAYPTPHKDIALWRHTFEGYAPEKIAALREGRKSVWLLAVTARKRGGGNR